MGHEERDVLPFSVAPSDGEAVRNDHLPVGDVADRADQLRVRVLGQNPWKPSRTASWSARGSSSDDDHHLRFGQLFEDLLPQLEAALIRESDVEEEHVWEEPMHGLPGLARRRRHGDLEAVPPRRAATLPRTASDRRRSRPR